MFSSSSFMRWFTISMLNLILKTILTKMLESDAFIFLILVTDFKSLYDCLIRLRTIMKKRLMMNVMILRQSYERREIIEVKWISDDDNSANSMIKIKSFMTLKIVIDINRIRLKSIEWVKRANQSEKIKNDDEIDKSDWIKNVSWFSEKLQNWYHCITISYHM